MTLAQPLSHVSHGTFNRVRELFTSNQKAFDLFTTLCRINILYMIQRAGSGHIGSSFSSIDIMAFLHLTDRPFFFSSKGHDAPARYAVLTAVGLLPFEKMHQFRRLGGLPGHPDVGTPHMYTNTGSLGMGISKARGMALANRLSGSRHPIYVMLGDGEMQEGQIWESLQPTANRGIDEITAILDHNKLQSDTFVERVSALGNLEEKLEAFGWDVVRSDGHSFNDLKKSVAYLQTLKGKPKFWIADTVKGKGVSFIEHTSFAPETRLYPFHSGSLSAEMYERALNELSQKANALLSELGEPPLELERQHSPQQQKPTHPQKLIAAYSNALVREGEKNKKIVVLDGDLALDTGVLEFEKHFPERFFECGIAEQDMVSQAGAFALNGYLPIVHSFSCFMTTRANEQIFNNATEQTKILYVGSLVGLNPSGPGHSHQSVRDIAILSGLPNLTMLEPSCEKEVEIALDFLVNRNKGSGYLRLVSVPTAIPYTLPDSYSLKLGQGVALTEGDDAILFSYGPTLLSQAFEAAQLLQKKNIQLKVVNLPWLNRIDSEWLSLTISEYAHLFTLDNHMVHGGPGQYWASEIASLSTVRKPQVHHLGVREIPKCGWNDEVLQAHQVSAKEIEAKVSFLLMNAPKKPTI
jgi:transketolase